MQLPFTKEQFFDLFAAYNAAVWPVLLALWLLSAAAAVRLFATRPPPDRWICVLLAVHWLWSGLVYHAAFFTGINPAAWLFAVLFLIQAAALTWLGVIRGRLSFANPHRGWATVAWILIGYSLVYPGINAALHLTVLRIPAFGVPCPTTIFTAGLLMLARPKSWLVSTVPVIWSAIGGSAASLLGVRADYALPLAGAALVLFTLSGRSSDPA